MLGLWPAGRSSTQPARLCPAVDPACQSAPSCPAACRLEPPQADPSQAVVWDMHTSPRGDASIADFVQHALTSRPGSGCGADSGERRRHACPLVVAGQAMPVCVVPAPYLHLCCCAGSPCLPGCPIPRCRRGPAAADVPGAPGWRHAVQRRRGPPGRPHPPAAAARGWGPGIAAAGRHAALRCDEQPAQMALGRTVLPKAAQILGSPVGSLVMPVPAATSPLRLR